jgi:hypothetical protein
MPEARPDTARLEARLVLLLLVELPTVAREPEDKREDRLVPLIELMVLVVVDIFTFRSVGHFSFVLTISIPPGRFHGESSDGALAPSEDFTVSSNLTD